MDLFLLEYDLLARVKGVVGSLLHHLENEEHFTSTSDRSKGTNNGSQFLYVRFVFSHFQRFFWIHYPFLLGTLVLVSIEYLLLYHYPYHCGKLFAFHGDRYFQFLYSLYSCSKQ